MPCNPTTFLGIGCCQPTHPAYVDETVIVYGWPKPCVNTPFPDFNCAGPWREDRDLETKVLACVQAAYDACIAAPWPGVGLGSVIWLNTDPFRPGDPQTGNLKCTTDDQTPGQLPVRGAYLGWIRGDCRPQFAGFPPPYIRAIKWRVHAVNLPPARTCRVDFHRDIPFNSDTAHGIDTAHTTTIDAASVLLEMLPTSGGIICPLSGLNNPTIEGSANHVLGQFESEAIPFPVCAFP